MQTYKVPATVPSNLFANTISGTQVNLVWAPPQKTTGLTKYLIYAGTSTTNMPQVGTTASGNTSFTVRNLKPATLYYFAVAAVESGVTSQRSPIAWTTTYSLPNAPESLTAVLSGKTVIVLNWQENTAFTGLPVISYQVFSGTSPTKLSRVAVVTNQTYTTGSLRPHTDYYFDIVAVDTAGETSTPSAQVSITTQ